MYIIYIVILAGILGAIARYLDKHLINLGISKNDYFYYMCLSMIPFSIIMIIIEYYTKQLKFSFDLVPILLLSIAMILRYKNNIRLLVVLHI